jgi:NTE family protein
VVNTFARHFADNPTGDVNLLPLLSLVNGGRLRGMMERTERHFGGASGLAIEDLWKPYFCIAANVTRAVEQVLDAGPLIPAVMARCAVPGAMPPVLRDGELLCDGGVFNNLPTDVMRSRWGIGRVIAVDLDLDRPQRLALAALPTPTQLVLDRLRPRARRRYRLPSLPSHLMNVTALQGTARQRAAAALADLGWCGPSCRASACCSGAATPPRRRAGTTPPAMRSVRASPRAGAARWARRRATGGSAGEG